VGAGYNSLNLLSQLKPDLIKLDIELVRDVDSDPYKAEIASKLLEAATNLGVRTVAEGIETEGEWRWFCENGADYGQGFAFAHPAATPPASRFPMGASIPA
jgi:EAL domain-containing protein (putative c-di-GMP-specific phosphodiesterase class I)